MFFKSGESVSFVPMSSEMESFLKTNFFRSSQLMFKLWSSGLSAKTCRCPINKKSREKEKTIFYFFGLNVSKATFSFVHNSIEFVPILPWPITCLGPIYKSLRIYGNGFD